MIVAAAAAASLRGRSGVACRVGRSFIPAFHAVRTSSTRAVESSVGDALAKAPKSKRAVKVYQSRPAPAERRATDSPAAYIHGLLRSCRTAGEALEVWSAEAHSADAIAHASALQRVLALQKEVAPHKRQPLPLQTFTARMADLQSSMLAELAAGKPDAPALNPRSLSSTLYAVGRSGMAMPQLVQGVVGAARGRFRRFNAKDLVQFLHGLSMAGAADAQVLAQAAERAARLRKHVSLIEAVSMATSAVSLAPGSAVAVPSPQHLREMYAFHQGRPAPPPATNAESLHLLLSLATHKLQRAIQSVADLPPAHLETALAKASVTPQVLANLTHAIAKSSTPSLCLHRDGSLTPTAQVMQSLRPALMASMRKQSLVGLISIASGYRTLGLVDVPLWALLLQAAQHPQRLGRGTGQQVAALADHAAWAHQQLAADSPEAAVLKPLVVTAVKSATAAMLHHADPPPDALTHGKRSTKRSYAPVRPVAPEPREITSLLRSLATVGLQDGQLAAVAGRQVSPRLRDLSPHAMAQYLATLPALHWKPHQIASALQYAAYFASVPAAIGKGAPPALLQAVLSVSACAALPPHSGMRALLAVALRSHVHPQAVNLHRSDPFRAAAELRAGDEGAERDLSAAMAQAGVRSVGAKNSPAGIDPQLVTDRFIEPLLRRAVQHEGKVPGFGSELFPPKPSSHRAQKPAAATSTGIGTYLQAHSGTATANEPKACRANQHSQATRATQWSTPDLVQLLAVATSIREVSAESAASLLSLALHKLVFDTRPSKPVALRQPAALRAALRDLDGTQQWMLAVSARHLYNTARKAPQWDASAPYAKSAEAAVIRLLECLESPAPRLEHGSSSTESAWVEACTALAHSALVHSGDAEHLTPEQIMQVPTPPAIVAVLHKAGWPQELLAKYAGSVQAKAGFQSLKFPRCPKLVEAV